MRISLLILSSIAILFTLATAFFVTNFLTSTIVTSLNSNAQINKTAEVRSVVLSMNTNANRLDYVIFMVFIGYILSILITGYVVGGNPVWIPVYFFIIVVSIISSMIMANIWETVTTMAVFGATINNFHITNYIMLNLPIFALAIGLVGVLAMFSRQLVGGNVNQL